MGAPVGLKRTAPMHRGLRKASVAGSDLGAERPPVEGTQARKVGGNVYAMATLFIMFARNSLHYKAYGDHQ